MLKLNSLQLAFLLALAGLLTPSFLLAAEVTVLPEQKAVIANAEFQTDITIDTGGEAINVFSGTLTFPDELVALKEIRLGGSVINYWVEEPQASGQEIRFAGMTPGGYNGSRGILFSLVFTATHEGQGTITINDPLFLRNDGHGSSAQISVGNSNINVLPPDQRRDIQVPPVTDTNPPEPFTPVVERSKEMFNNAWVLIFATQDKESGIDHYEVSEKAGGLLSFLAPWKRATSPFVLENQATDTNIAVKAVDKAGNVRTVYVSPKNPAAWYANLNIWFVIVGIIALIILLKGLVWRKR